MKILFTALILFTSYSMLPGQVPKLKAEVEFGPIFKDSETISAFVEENDNGILVLRESIEESFRNRSNNDYYLQYFDHELAPSKKELILKEGSGNDRDFFHFSVFNDELHLLTTSINKQRKETYLYDDLIDKETLKIKGKSKKIGTIKHSRSGGKGAFDFTKSHDESKILVLSYHPFAKKGNESFDLTVFNSSYEVLWQKEITLPKLDSEVYFDSHHISNNGVVSLIVRWHYEGEDYYINDKENFEYRVLTYFNEGSLENHYTLDIDQFLRLDSEGNILMIRFFFNYAGIIQGFYYTLYDLIKEKTLIESRSEIDLSIYRAGISKRKETKKNSYDEFSDFSIDSIIINADGSGYVLAEQSFLEWFVKY